MKYTGTIIFVCISLIIFLLEALFNQINVLTIILTSLVSVFAFLVGLSYDHRMQSKTRNEENYHSDLIKYSPEPIIVYKDNIIVFGNKRLEQLLNLEAKHFIGKSVFDFILPEFHEIVNCRIQKMCSGTVNIERTELRISVNNADIVDIEVASAPIIYKHEPSIVVFIRDITNRIRLEQLVKKNEAMYKFVTENSTDIISYIKATGHYEYLSPSFHTILGYQPEEVIGCKMFEFFHKDETPFILDKFERANTSIDFATFQHRFRKKDGSYIWLETNARTIRNSSNQLEGIVSVSRDITERMEREMKLIESNEMLKYLSNIDGLTNIPNRRFLEETLLIEWNRTKRQSSPLSVIMLDIDCFKGFNDYYGHLAGDECIKQIAHLIKNSLKRPGDFVARFGGEEFVIVLPETDSEGAKYIGQLLLTNVRKLEIPNKGSNISDFLTVSMGIATIVPISQYNPEDLLQLADKQLYLAKENGRNQIKAML